MFTKADLDLAEQRVADAEQLVAEQVRRAAELYLAGADPVLAHELLETFRESLAIKERDRDLIRADLEKSGVRHDVSHSPESRFTNISPRLHDYPGNPTWS
jgi:hypothetical protein